MVDLARIGEALMGFSAGANGNGAQFLQQQQVLTDERKKALAEDMFEVRNILKTDPLKAAEFLNERKSHIKRLRGDPKETDQLIGMIEGGDITGAMKELDEGIATAQMRGYLPKQEAPKPVDASKVKNGQVVVEDGQGGFRAIKVQGFNEGEAKEAERQFGAQVIAKDSAGNLFLTTQMRNPDGGEVKTVFSPLSGAEKPSGKVEIAGPYGLTAKERVAQLGSEADSKSRAAQEAKILTDFKKTGLAARDMLPKIDKMIDLVNAVETGKTAPARKLMADIFNLKSQEAADLGLLNSMAGQMVLGQIRMLGANPTEGERKFLTDITASIEQGNEINSAVLNQLREVTQNQFERARMLSKNPGMTLDDILLLEEKDTPTSTKVTGRYNPQTRKVEYSE